MTRFNLSEWALRHRSITLFAMLALAAAGAAARWAPTLPVLTKLTLSVVPLGHYRPDVQGMEKAEGASSCRPRAAE